MITDLASLDGTEQGKEFIELDLRDVYIVQDILGKGLEMLRGLHQPLQHRVRVHLEHPRHGTDTQASLSRLDFQGLSENTTIVF